MCGICGEIRFTTGANGGGLASAAAIERMAEAMAPRGPDGAGVVLRGPVGFGHRRLKIIDLSEASAQPFVDTHLGLTIAFNGCIYNYPELRKELEDKGHRFASRGDTEVILKAWAEWGLEAPARLKGMFAFAIHDRDTGRVALVRDRFGIKPMYLAESPGRLRFASTLPALLAAGEVDTSIDHVALHHYMTWHAVVPARARSCRACASWPPPRSA
jgi:asparagine synthase (glutamine-hydrolysing)